MAFWIIHNKVQSIFLSLTDLSLQTWIEIFPFPFLSARSKSSSIALVWRRSLRLFPTMNAAISSQIISSEYFTNFYFSYYKTITFICIFSLARRKGNFYYHRKKELKNTFWLQESNLKLQIQQDHVIKTKHLIKLVGVCCLSSLNLMYLETKVHQHNGFFYPKLVLK